LEIPALKGELQLREACRQKDSELLWEGRREIRGREGGPAVRDFGGGRVIKS